MMITEHGTACLLACLGILGNLQLWRCGAPVSAQTSLLMLWMLLARGGVGWGCLCSKQQHFEFWASLEPSSGFSSMVPHVSKLA